jgi:hypothetical protein
LTSSRAGLACTVVTERDLHYAFVLPVQAYPLGPQRFAVEGGFADHLRLMLRMHKPRFSRMTLAGPVMSAATYLERKVELGGSDDSIRFVGLYDADASDSAFTLARRLGKKTISVTDIDDREAARR